MGITPGTLSTHIYRATKEGWLKFDDPLSRVEFQLIPKIVRNLDEFLEDRDRTVTIEAAKGTLFKQYAESKGVTNAPTTVLALKLELPSGETKAIFGKVVGSGRALDDDDIVEPDPA